MELEAMRQGRQDVMRLAQAFDGIGGAIHEGHALAMDDLEDAVRTARTVWPPGTSALRQGFDAACDALVLWAPDAAQGDRVALGYVQRAAYAIAKSLGMRADIIGMPLEPELATEAEISRLDAAFARYAPHPARDAGPVARIDRVG